MKKKKEIKKQVESILKCLKIKITIFFITEILILLFFLYYITSFCSVYKKTQVSWIYDIIISYILSFFISLGISLACSIIYLISYKKKIKFLYIITIFIYEHS